LCFFGTAKHVCAGFVGCEDLANRKSLHLKVKNQADSERKIQRRCQKLMLGACFGNGEFEVKCLAVLKTRVSIGLV
jgi:hypothetical protein